jgi:hypothetical protein
MLTVFPEELNYQKMKKILLSLLLIGSVSSLFAQPGTGCPIDIKSNQGGGSCGPCTSQNDGSNTNLGDATAKVTLTFSGTLTCAPRLREVEDQEGNIRIVRCGEGEIVSTVQGKTRIEYCIYGENNDNFFNKPDLKVTLDYTNCPVPNFGRIKCNQQGELIPLPVNFKSFNASRIKSNVAVKWTTATEVDNKGFWVQRKTRGGWENLKFVASQAQGGNSSSDLSYSFSDLNLERGISQYRILQVDLDGRAKSSDIRSVRGEAMGGKLLLFPNPSINGSANIVFDDAISVRDVIISDVSGRIIKQWKGLKDNSLYVNGLMIGTYMIRVIDKQNGTIANEKLVIRKG